MGDRTIMQNHECDYSIGIVTYVERYEKSFKKLALDLAKYFPDIEKNVIINGFYDKPKQIKYLKDVTGFLRECGYNRVLTYEEHQPLAKGWNLLAILSTKPKILILNDDCEISEKFRKEFESQRKDLDWVFINGTFSHFQTSKNIVKKIGWFDERFSDIGSEDGDYARRFILNGYPYDVSIDCPGLINRQFKEDAVGFAKNDSKRNGNYSKYNEQFFKKKWKHSEVPRDGYVKIYSKHVKEAECQNRPTLFRRVVNLLKGRKRNLYVKLSKGMETPIFYPYELLD
jgi:hypothetical protein